jgi:hybrid polyketide synthase/nonribosomal peptide synthetase ACE1
MFWSLEPEIAFENGRDFIPRVQLSRLINNRYNSSRRLITEDVDPNSRPLTLSYSATTPVLKITSGLVPMPIPVAKGIIQIQVSYSSLKSVKVGSFGYLFLVLGTNTVTGRQIIAFSKSLSSQVGVPENWTRPCPTPPNQAKEYLIVMFHILLSNSVLMGLSRGESIVILEPNKSFAAILEASAIKRGIKLKFLTSAYTDHQQSWTTIHPRASKPDFDAILPRKLSLALSLDRNDWASSLIENLSTRCTVETADTLTRFDASINSFADDPRILEALDAARIQMSSVSLALEFADIPVCSLQDVLDPSVVKHPVAVVNWDASSTVAVPLEPVDTRPMFRNDKTYWLVGLTGGLGLSLCKWMVVHGARYIVISSRNPKVDPRWISDFEAAGATLKVYAKYNIILSPFEIPH